jgi:SAM-dependent methyltransferase
MPLTDPPRVIDGIRCYAPQMAESYEGYPAAGFDVTVEVEERSFWCRSRNRLVLDLVRRYAPARRPLKLLEIGCGTGNVLRRLRELPGLELTGSEAYLGGLRHAQRRLPDVEFIQMDATAMPFIDELDLVGAFDVLEHIDDDVAVLRNVRRALIPGGLLLLTVPQYPWMWSRLDEIVRHRRRYTRSGLGSRLSEAGLERVFLSSFFCILFPLMALRRLLPDRQPADDDAAEFESHVRFPRLLNATFDLAMRLDEWAIRAGLRLPFGGSLVAVARRPERGSE